MTETVELDRLRARIVELESQLADRGGARRPKRSRGLGRATASTVLIVIACILIPLSAVAVWASNEVSNTDRYVDTVAPLADDPGVQHAIATNVTQAIIERLDVQGVATEALNAIADQPNVPPRVAAVLPGLSVPLTNGVEGFVGDQVANFVASSQFATIWQQANRVAHQQMVKLLEGNQGGAVTAQNGEVSLELGPIVAQVKQRLLDRGFELANNIPEVQRSFVLVQTDAVTKAQGVYRLLNTLGNWLPFIALALFALGVYVARDHRRALLFGALGAVAAILIFGVLLAVFRLRYLDAVPADVLPRDAAASVFDTIVRFLRTGIRAIAVLGLVVALVAFAFGPSATAQSGRRALARGISALGTGAGRAGWSSGRLGVWLAEHKRPVDVGLVGLGALVLTFWGSPTGAGVVMVALGVLVLVLVVEFLAFRPTTVVTESSANGSAPGDGAGPPAPEHLEPVGTWPEPQPQPPPEGSTAASGATPAGAGEGTAASTVTKRETGANSNV